MSKNKLFVQLPFEFLDSTWPMLSGNAAKIYVDVVRRYTGRNNGRIIYGVREAAAIGIKRDNAAKALTELQDYGLLRAIKAQGFRTARRWEITDR
jgi:hypothetical protein